MKNALAAIPLAIVIAIGILVSGNSNAADSSPNILLILADDRTGDLC
ncbi:MAG: hypothetical protein ACI9R3_002593 [Verrucomicrobiales bacterium]|jgi:hypothetical protein